MLVMRWVHDLAAFGRLTVGDQGCSNPLATTGKRTVNLTDRLRSGGDRTALQAKRGEWARQNSRTASLNCSGCSRLLT